MGDECPTCHRSSDLGDELYSRLEKGSFFTKLQEKMAGTTTNQADLKTLVADAVKSIEFKPTVKLTHHGIEDLQKCTDCAPKLASYVDGQVAQKMLAQKTGWTGDRRLKHTINKTPETKVEEPKKKDVGVFPFQ